MLLAPSLKELNAAATLPLSTGGRKAGGAEGILTLIPFTEIKRFSKAEMTARLHCRWRDSSICSTAMGSEALRFLPCSEPASAMAGQHLSLPGPECKCPEQCNGWFPWGEGDWAHCAQHCRKGKPVFPSLFLRPMPLPLHHSMYSYQSAMATRRSWTQIRSGQTIKYASINSIMKHGQEITHVWCVVFLLLRNHLCPPSPPDSKRH